MAAAEKAVFDEAKTLLVDIGWAPGNYAIDQKRRATEVQDPMILRIGMLGALLLASMSSPESTPAMYDLTRQVLREVVMSRNLADWEDAKGRTLAQILDALTVAAEIAENEIFCWEDPLEKQLSLSRAP